MASYQQVLRARNHAVRTKTAYVNRWLDSYARQRRMGPPQGPRSRSTADVRGWDRASASTVSPHVRDLTTAIDRLEDSIKLARDDAYSWIPPWRWGEIPRNRDQVRRSQDYRSSTTLLRDANQAIDRYRRTAMWQFDTVNTSWWDRMRARAGRRVEDAPAQVGRAVGTAGRALVEEAVRPATSGKITPDSPDVPPTESDERGWNLFLIGTVGLGVLILGGGLAVGLASRKKGKKNPKNDFGRRMKAHRRGLRGKAR